MFALVVTFKRVQRTDGISAKQQEKDRHFKLPYTVMNYRVRHDKADYLQSENSRLIYIHLSGTKCSTFAPDT